MSESKKKPVGTALWNQASSHMDALKKAKEDALQREQEIFNSDVLKLQRWSKTKECLAAKKFLERANSRVLLGGSFAFDKSGIVIIGGAGDPSVVTLDHYSDVLYSFRNMIDAKMSPIVRIRFELNKLAETLLEYKG